MLARSYLIPIPFDVELTQRLNGKMLPRHAGIHRSAQGLLILSLGLSGADLLLLHDRRNVLLVNTRGHKLLLEPALVFFVSKLPLLALFLDALGLLLLVALDSQLGLLLPSLFLLGSLLLLLQPLVLHLLLDALLLLSLLFAALDLVQLALGPLKLGIVRVLLRETTLVLVLGLSQAQSFKLHSCVLSLPLGLGQASAVP